MNEWKENLKKTEFRTEKNTFSLRFLNVVVNDCYRFT